MDEINKYELVESNSFDDALRLLKTTFFDVLVIDDRGNPETDAQFEHRPALDLLI